MHDAMAYDLTTIGCGPAHWGRDERTGSRRERKRAAIAAMQAAESGGGRRGGRLGGPDFGGWGGWGGDPRFGRGRKRMRRGDVRGAILVLLDEQPRNGYQLMQEIENRSDGVWRPSPGSVYPALSQLEDEGLVKATEAEGRKAFELTSEGSAHVSEHREKIGEPWAGLTDDVSEQRLSLRDQIKPLMGAVGQIMHSGSEQDARRAADVLADTRRKLYAILAEDVTNGED
ncbi:MAG: PadR family transcriptional regulator [Solirubrobacterales bacterium]